MSEEGLDVVDKKKLWELPGGTVKVQPILRRRGMINDPSHTMFFMLEGTDIKLPVPNDRNGQVMCPLTEEERAYFEDSSRSGLPFKRGDLSPFNEGHDNYWKRKETTVRLVKEGFVLDLSKPYDYITYAILRCNKSLIASTTEDMNRKTCLFALVPEDFEITERVSSADKKKTAYRESAKLENDRDAMIDFLTVYGKRPATTAKSKFLISEIDKIIENDLNGFLKIIQDDEYETRLLINKAVRIGAIVKKGDKYELKGGDKLSLVGEINNLNGAINYLKAIENQDVLLTIKAQLDKAKI
jgi:hypothetical protein